jgi:hypothetical protein
VAWLEIVGETQLLHGGLGSLALAKGRYFNATIFLHGSRYSFANSLILNFAY